MDTYQRNTILSHSSTNVKLRLDSNNKLEYSADPPLYANGTASTETIANYQTSIVSFILDNTLGFSINGTFHYGVAKNNSGSSTFNQIGTAGASSDRFNGKMGEIMIIDSVSSTDRHFEAYLAYKWGLTGQLPTGHLQIKRISVGRNLPKAMTWCKYWRSWWPKNSHPFHCSYPATTNGITSYPPMTGAPERSILTARRYPQHPHPVQLLQPEASSYSVHLT